MDLVVVGLTVAGALLLALLQLGMKLASRLRRWRKPHPVPADWPKMIELEDWLFWPEWVIAAVAAMTILVGKAAHEGKGDFGDFVVMVVVIILGLIFTPVSMSLLFYNERGEIKSWAYALAADLIGLGFLVGVVLAGARIYG